MRQVFVVAALASIAGCVTDAPRGPDTEAPRLTVQIQNVTEGPGSFSSTDPVTESACVKVRSFPAKISITAADSGGVSRFAVRVFPAVIDRASVTLAPAAPEGSYTISAERGGETLTASFTRPAPDKVRTGAVAVFEATGADASNPDFALTASAFDNAGNVTHLAQIDVRPNDPAIICE